MSAQRVIITAGASGIGLAIARKFISQAARVAICDVDAARLQDLAAEMPDLITALVDVSNPAQVNDFVVEVKDAFGGIDVLVNNAGIAGPTAAIEDIADGDWTRSFDVNIHGAFYMLRAVTPVMKAQGGGAVINISTGSVFTLPLNRSPYIASKWAVEGLTRAAARELGPSNIRVNAIRPGFVDSDRMRMILGGMADQAQTTVEALEARFFDFISMRTKIQPEEIADMALFLASPAAKHVTGQLIAVDGNVEWE